MTVWLMVLFVHLGTQAQAIIVMPDEFQTEQYCLQAAMRVGTNMASAGTVPTGASVNIVCLPASKGDQI